MPKFIEFLFLDGLVVEFDALILFVDYLHNLFTMVIKDCVDALHFSTARHKQFIGGSFICFFVLFLFFARLNNCISIFCRYLLFEFCFSFALLESEDMGFGDPDVFGVLLLMIIFEQS